MADEVEEKARLLGAARACRRSKGRIAEAIVRVWPANNGCEGMFREGGVDELESSSMMLILALAVIGRFSKAYISSRYR